MRLMLLVAFLSILPACRAENVERAEATVAALPSPVRQKSLPPSLEAKDCSAVAPAGELPVSRFARKGGRETEAAARSEGGLLTVEGVGQGRDLSRYERLDLPETNWEKRVAAARAFLWEHWRGRKQAYLTLTGSSDDATSTSHIFVEEDEGGRWRVAWRIVRHLGAINDLPTYYGVEWVRPGGWRKPGKPLGRGEAADPEKHELEFRDKCGDVEQSL